MQPADNPAIADDSPPSVRARRAALQHFLWRVAQRLSSGLAGCERFLAGAGFERAPWLAVAFAAGIGVWFILANRWQWLALMAALVALAVSALSAMREDGRYPYLRQAIASLALVAAAGCGLVWAKSSLVGMKALPEPFVGQISATVVGREEQPAEGRVRLVLAMREEATGRPVRVRVNVALDKDAPGAVEGAQVRLKARLVPPAAPMLPGSYDFARTAWFEGLAATGSALSRVEVVKSDGAGDSAIRRLQRAISSHVREAVPGSAGGIAAAFASGDRGGIAKADEDAMRDSGLTHLLSISGLHVSAVIAATWFLAMRLFGLWPWLVLRFRLPLLAAASAALVGIGYTLLTGAEVPTIRSCLGALLVLAALAIGREPLSLRMVAVAAFIVMLFWPEAVVGPSFQMSFAAVIAIVALHGAAPVHAFLAPREEPWWQHGMRRLAMLLLTGVVIEFALMPIGLFHFHRAGVYGAAANVIAIPLTTFVSMPLIALALLFDAVGAGGPFWWLAGKSLELMLALAHWVAARPGAVTHLPAMGAGGFALFVAGGLWLALWRGRVRFAGLLPIAFGVGALAMLSPPDLLVSGDGRHVGITRLAGDELVVLRDARSDYARDNLTELAGMNGRVRRIDEVPQARCSSEFCALELERGGRTWHLLMARGTEWVSMRDLLAACELSDIVIADRWLPRACKPRVLKADRSLLDQTGGLTIDLGSGRVRSVAEGQGEHGWWAPAVRPPRSPDTEKGAGKAPAPNPSATASKAQ
ncbi:metal-binding protein [Novosphingobium sp. TH158]|nr:metal-binding protein [Novosphingobium sp. TH158]